MTDNDDGPIYSDINMLKQGSCPPSVYGMPCECIIYWQYNGSADHAACVSQLMMFGFDNAGASAVCNQYKCDCNGTSCTI